MVFVRVREEETTLTPETASSAFAKMAAAAALGDENSRYANNAREEAARLETSQTGATFRRTNYIIEN